VGQPNREPRRGRRSAARHPHARPGGSSDGDVRVSTGHQTRADVRDRASDIPSNEAKELIMTPQFIEVVAILACTLFTGAAVYITPVEPPARLSCGAEAAVAEWAPSYKRATLTQVPLALVAGLFGIVRGTQRGGPLWLRWSESSPRTLTRLRAPAPSGSSSRVVDGHLEPDHAMRLDSDARRCGQLFPGPAGTSQHRVSSHPGCPWSN
jgi:hypothetical protein